MISAPASGLVGGLSPGVIELRTLGVLELTGPEGRELTAILVQPKRLALLVHLCLGSRDGFQRRDSLVALFWPELDAEHARGALRQALRFLRRALGEGVIVTRGDEEVGIDSTAVEFDVHEFERAYRAGRCREAIKRYHGDFLNGFFVGGVAPEFTERIEGERTRLRGLAALAFGRLAEEHRAAGDSVEAVAWSRQASGILPDDEVQLRSLLRLLDGAGDRAGAVRLYEEFAKKLREEYGAEPSEASRGLIRALRAGIPRGPPSATSSEGLEQPPGSAAPFPAGPESAPNPRIQSRSPIWGGLALGGSLLLIAAVAAALWDRVARTPVRLALLPIETRIADSASGYLAEGLTAGVRARLGRIGRLRITPKGDFRDEDLTSRLPVEIGARLGVDAILTGGLEWSGDSVRLESHLVRIRDGFELTGQERWLPRSEFHRIEVELSHDIAVALGVDESIKPGGTTVGDAYAAFVRGQYHLGRRDTASIRRARDLFAEAIDRDPAYADAYVGLAYAYGAFAHYQIIPSAEAFRLSDAASRTALTLNPTSGMARALLAATQSFQNYRWGLGERGLREAVAAEPSNADVHNQLAIHLRVQGRFDEAAAEAGLAHWLEPLSRHYAFQVAFVDLCAGREAAALRAVRETNELGVDGQMAHLLAADALARLGRFEEAAQDWRRSLLLAGDSTGASRVGAIASQDAYWALRHQRAVERLEYLRQRMKTAFVAPGILADGYIAAGEVDSALAWLAKAYASRDVGLIKIGCNRDYDSIRRDPRFVRIMEQVGIPADPRAPR